MGFLADSPTNKLNLKLLNKKLAEGSISNPYIFYGGSMKHLMEIALYFAAGINCRDKGCMECQTCRNTLKLKYPNLHILDPIGNSIVVEEIQDFITGMSLSSTGNEFKIGIIKEADLGGVYFDPLLKTLEDPPDEKSVFIFLAEDINSIRPTIRSRCQSYNWMFKDGMLEEYNEKYLNFKTVIENGLSAIISDRSNITSALGVSGSVKDLIDETWREEESRIKKENDKIKKSGLDKDLIERIIKEMDGRHKRAKSKLANLIIMRVFDIIADYLEDIIAVIAGSRAEALHYAENYNIIRDNFKDEGINKFTELLEVIRENSLYLNKGIYYEIALDRILLGLVRH
jgi:DNA polymerase III delta prime subunit